MRNEWHDSWKKWLGLTTAALAAFSLPAVAQETDEDLEEVEGFIVTGSRIRQLDLQTVNPVIRLDSDALDATGFTTIGDAVRSLPFNNGQALTPTDSGTSFTPGVSTANLRGLGNNNTLVLLNGRRTAPYASPGFDGFQTVFDLNSIPQAAIDNIEILKDGASAVYGSDAVAGVMNVSLRTDYEGASVSGMIGNYFTTDGFFKKGSFITGATTAKTSLVMTFDWQEQNAVFARDIDWSKNADKTSVAAESNPRLSVSGYESLGYSSEEEYWDAFGTDDPILFGFFDLRSSRGFPGYVTVTDNASPNSPYLDDNGDQVIREDGLPVYIKDNQPMGFPEANGRLTNTPYYSERVSYGTPTGNPTLAGADFGLRNFYNYQERNGLFPENRMYSFYARGEHNITDNLYAFAEVSFSRSEAQVHSAPTPVDIETSQGLSVGTQLTIPTYNPYNPFGVDIVNGRRRMIEPENRISDVTSDTPRVLAGLGGDIASDVIDNWTWEVGALYVKNTVENISRNSIPDYRMQQAFNGLTRQPDGSLTWDSNTPQDERVYYNWFGFNEEAFTNFLAITNPNVASLEYRSLDFNTSGQIPALELPGGPVSFSAGAERRLEDFANVKSDLNATGMILGGSEGTSSFGARSLNSVYAEVMLPVIDQVEVQLAGRWEDYSDEGFESDIRPKIGVLYRPLEWLSIRGSYSESFKAPDLAYLYTASQTSFSAEQLMDPLTGSQIDQIQIVTSGNPDLVPEISDTYYVGFTLEPTGKLEGFRFFFDYLEWDQEDLLAQLSDFYDYAEFLTEAADGNETFSDAVVRDTTTNQLLYIRDDYDNIGTGTYIGYDFGASYSLTTEVGDWFFQWNATYVREQLINDDDIVGSYLSPEWRHTINVNYNYGDWSANLLGVFIDGRTRSLNFGSFRTNATNIYDDEVILTYDIDSQIVLNGSVSYSGLWDTTITLGVNNLLDEEPPVDPFDALGTTPGVNLPEPAFWYLRFERDF